MKESITSRIPGTLKKRPEYNIWRSIKDRCFNPFDKSYKHYGGRGIGMYQEWINSFQAFYDYIGDRPRSDLTLDRKNNNGNYEPGNLRWATAKFQARNRSDNLCVTVNGVVYKSLAEACEVYCVSYSRTKKRITSYKCDAESAIFLPKYSKLKKAS